MVAAVNSLGRKQEPTVRGKQAAAGCCFQLCPNLVGTQDEWHELTALPDSLPGDARLAVRRALIVWRHEAVYADDLGPELRGLVERGAAHGTQPDHDNIGSDGHLAMMPYLPGHR